MNEQLTRIETKLDKVIERQAEHSASLAVHDTLHKQNTVDLEHHSKRIDILQTQMATALLPIRAVKWLVGVAGGVTVLLTLLNLIKG